MPASMPLAQLKRTLKDRVAEDIALVLQDLKHLVCIPATYNALIELEARLKAANRAIHSGTLSFEQRELLYPRLRKDVLVFIDSLTDADLQAAGEARSDKKANEGSILYRIPGVMQLNKVTRCIVRLAYLKKQLLEKIDLNEDTVIKQIQVSKVMEVKLKDPSKKAFSITPLTRKKSFLHKDYYTEWLFDVTPTREGIYPLMLKVVVVEKIDGEKIKRDIVLEESIQIVTAAPATDEPFTTSEHALVTDSSTIPDRQLSLFPAIRRMAGVFVFLLITSVATYAVVPREVDWQLTKYQNTERAYKDFINKYEDKGEKYIEIAAYKHALIANKVEVYKSYLEKRVQYRGEIARSYFDEVLHIAKYQSDIAPLIDFIQNYDYDDYIFKETVELQLAEMLKNNTDIKQIEKIISAMTDEVGTQFNIDNVLLEQLNNRGYKAKPLNPQDTSSMQLLKRAENLSKSKAENSHSIQSDIIDTPVQGQDYLQEKMIEIKTDISEEERFIKQIQVADSITYFPSQRLSLVS